MRAVERFQTELFTHWRNPSHIVEPVLDHPVFSAPSYVWHAITTSVIKRFDSTPTVQEAVAEFQPKHESLGDRFSREIEFFRRSAKLDRAFRGINGLRYSLTGDGSKFGEYLRRAYNDFKFRDHGKDHSRRVKKFIELLYQNSPEIKITWDSVIEAMASFSWTHDMHQVIVKVWNDETGLKMKEKDGHDHAGSIMRMATCPEFARERKISDEKAWEISAIDAFFCLDHDDSKPLKELYSATKRADSDEYKTENAETIKYLINGSDIAVSKKLIDDLEKGEIDIKTLSLRQMMLVMIHKLAANREMAQKAGQNTRYGLLPDFEVTHPILNKFLTEEKYNVPLFENLTPDKIDSMQTGKAWCIIADRFDMFAPSFTLMRKFDVQRSTERPFFLEKYKGQLMNAVEFIRQLTYVPPRDGNPEHTSEYHHSDTHRQIYEIMTVKDIIEGTGLEGSLFLNNIIAQHQLSALYHFKSFGQRFMRGDATIFDEVYEFRELALAKKVLRKLRVSKDEVAQVDLVSDIDKKIQRAKALIMQYGNGSNLQENFIESVRLLEDEKSHLIDERILKKPENKKEEKIYDYGVKVVKEFEAVCDYYIQEIKNQGILDEGDCLAIEALTAVGENPPLGISSYDSAGRMTDMKTLIGHRESILVKLILTNRQVRRMVTEGKFIVEKKRHLDQVRADAFGRFGLKHLLGGKLPDWFSDSVYRRLHYLRETGYEDELKEIVDETLLSSPNKTPEIETFNRFFMMLGFSPEQQVDFQRYAWEQIKLIYPEEEQARFKAVREFAEFAYAFHEKRRTKDDFINHPLSVSVLGILNRWTHEYSPEFTKKDREDIEVRIFHDLVEDMWENFAFVQDGDKHFIICKEIPDYKIQISKDQFILLNALTRKPGRDDEWLNQIMSLPLLLRGRAASIKQDEIIHNSYTGQYKTYLEAIQRTEEHERTLIVLAVSSVFSLRHPFKSVKDAVGLLAGIPGLNHFRIVTPSFCASSLKELYYFLAERELIRKLESYKSTVNIPMGSALQNRPTRQVIADTLYPLMYREDGVSEAEYTFMTFIGKGQNMPIRAGDDRMIDLSPHKILGDFWSRRGIFPLPAHLNQPQNIRGLFPVGLYSLENYTQYLYTKYRDKTYFYNPYSIGSLNSIWFNKLFPLNTVNLGGYIYKVDKTTKQYIKGLGVNYYKKLKDNSSRALRLWRKANVDSLSAH